MTSLHDPTLAFAAAVVDDIESLRQANVNRAAQMTRSEPDADGVMRGYCMSEADPNVAWFAGLVDALAEVEKKAVSNLERQLRRHPLRVWQQANRGVGLKQGARLIAALGDPYIRPDWERPDGTVVPEGPRTVASLRRYCGLDVRDGLAPRRQRNQQSNWNDTARMRLWNVANKCVQNGIDTRTCISKGKSDTDFAVHTDECGCGAYRLTYDAGRETYADAKHDYPCIRCGPKGKPAEPGTPLTDAHKKARAVRLVMRQILADLWAAAREWHLQNGATS